MAESAQQFYSLEEVAQRLQVSDQTVRRWIKAGKLSAYKPGREYRIAPSSLEEFLESYSYPKAGVPPPREAPEEAAEEEQRTKILSSEDLQPYIAFMRLVNEERERQIEAVASREWPGRIGVWICDVEATELRLANLYKEEGITEAVEKVNQGGQVMTSDEVRRLSQVFEREFATLQQLTKEAKLVAQNAESKTHLEGVRLGAETQLWLDEGRVWNVTE